MTDHELEQRLRAWYRAEIRLTSAPPTADAARVGLLNDRRLGAGNRARSHTARRRGPADDAIVGGALVAGSGTVTPPSPVPALLRRLRRGPLGRGFATGSMGRRSAEGHTATLFARWQSARGRGALATLPSPSSTIPAPVNGL